MTTIKAYTDLEQSKKLAEFLPLESADMYFTGHQSITNPKEWEYRNIPEVRGKYIDFDDKRIFYPCWSLAALLNVLPKGEYEDTDLCFGGYKGDKYIPECFCSYEQQEHLIIEICHAPNPVDACYELILKLHELKLL